MHASGCEAADEEQGGEGDDGNDNREPHAGTHFVERLRQRGKLFLEVARQHGLPTGSAQGYSVVPVIVGDSMHCIRLTQALFRRGIHVQPILHPAVDEHEARLRLFLTCTHSEDQIRHSVAVIAEELRATRSA